MLFQNSCAQNFLDKLEATPHLNGKHVVFGKVRSPGQKGSIEWIQHVQETDLLSRKMRNGIHMELSLRV